MVEGPNNYHVSRLAKVTAGIRSRWKARNILIRSDDRFRNKGAIDRCLTLPLQERIAAQESNLKALTLPLWRHVGFLIPMAVAHAPVQG